MGKDYIVIYRILKTLQKWRGREDFNNELISAQKMGLSYESWEQLIIELQENGYINGVVYSQSITDKFPHLAEPITPRITLKGIAFLEDNSLMSKAANVLKMLGEFIP
jgi:hypothetical protein